MSRRSPSQKRWWAGDRRARGLELYGYHGVEEEEKRLGQPFVFDVWLDVGDRGADDRIEHAVDYRRSREAVRR
jgi:dihydroneopterin aldolase